MHVQVSTDQAPRPTKGAPYSQAVALEGLVFVSGQLPVDPETGELVGGDVADQTRQVLRNLSAVLEAAGSDLEHVLKTTVYLSRRSDWAAMNAVYAEFLATALPARTAVVAAEMALGALVEIDAIASR